MHNARMGVHSVGVQEVGVHSALVHCVSVLSKDVSAVGVQRTCLSSGVKINI